jgi:WD40 repeat protein
MKRGLLFTLLALLVALSAFSALWAQEDTPDLTSIPFESLAAGSELSPDDRTLALYNNPIIYGSENLETTPEESQIRLLDIETGKLTGSLQGNLDWVSDIAFNSDGSRLVAFHRNGDLSLWDIPNQTLLKTIPTYVYGGGWVLFMPDDQTVLLRLGEFVFGTLDTTNGAITRLFGRHIDTYNLFSETYTRYPERADLTIAAAAVSPDGSIIATSTGNDEVLLWDTSSGEARTLRQKSEQPARFAIRTLFFAADGSELLYYDQTDGHVHRWDIATQTEFQPLELAASTFAVAPGEPITAWADRETNTVNWYIGRDVVQQQFKLPDELGIAPNITQLFFTSDGTKLVVSGLFASAEQNAVYVISLAE